MKKRDIKVGDSVTCRESVEAYYSGYAGNPVVRFSPGMLGVVGSVDVPPVWQRRKKQDKPFICVDFEVSGVFSGNPKHRNDTWRCALRYDNIVKNMTEKK